VVVTTAGAAWVIIRPGGHVTGGLVLAGCAVLAVLFLNTATTSSVITLVTLYLQNTLHRSQPWAVDGACVRVAYY
jgi:hypothetical protein